MKIRKIAKFWHFLSHTWHYRYFCRQQKCLLNHEKVFVMWFVCCSPEDESEHSWLGAAAEAGKGKAEAATRPPPTNPTTGQCSSISRAVGAFCDSGRSFKPRWVVCWCEKSWCVFVDFRRQQEETRCLEGWTMTGTHRCSSHPWMSGSELQTMNQH